MGTGNGTFLKAGWSEGRNVLSVDSDADLITAVKRNIEFVKGYAEETVVAGVEEEESEEDEDAAEDFRSAADIAREALASSRRNVTTTDEDVVQ